MRPTGNVSSPSAPSIRVFQNRIAWGNPSRSRGPGSSSRKKLASWLSNDRSPLGTTLIVRLPISEAATAVADETDGGDDGACDGGGATREPVAEDLTGFS